MKYEVTFACGHTETVVLFGKHVDRERRIKWYEEYGNCSDCRRAERMAEPITALVQFSATRNSYCVRLSGYTYDRKDAIKQSGYKWDGDKRTWYKLFETEDECHDAIGNLEELIDTVVLTKMSENIEKNKQIGALEAERKAKVQAKIDEIKSKKPVKPKCIANGYWNGSFYRSNKGDGWKRVYIDNEETHLDPEQVAEIEKYKRAMEHYKECLEAEERKL